MELYDTKEKLEKFEKITRSLEQRFEDTTRKHEERVIALENRLKQYSDEHTWKISGFRSQLWDRKSP